ncbi:MAG TPA: CarD family transcriptional regulator, partial [Acidimicrobiales bacterium]|nr:CarD family transcriptional regulator [Acidimicrobiales bacterium]
MGLGSLPSLLRDERDLTRLVGQANAAVAVPEPARAFVVAGLSHLSDRAPILVITPSGSDAERLAHDLGAWLGREQVATFPAWETLPFERMSPSVEVMGRRLRVLWHLRGGATRGADGEASPLRVVVAPVKALVQRLGPAVPRLAPVVVRPGDVLDPEELVAALVATGYRREYQVEHRGEVAVRGGIVDVFPSTAEAPVRIDLWGDEVDRLTEFDPGDQRSVADLEVTEIHGCRELVPTDEVRARARELVATQPWGREQWERLAEGLSFDGMESWLPWLVGTDQVLPDLLGSQAQIVVVEPRRMRDRAAELVAEERALAATLAQTWGVVDHEDFPPLHLDFDRLLAQTEAPVWSMVSTAEGPEMPAVDASRWDPVVGDGSHLAKRVGELVADGWRVTVCADGEGSAARLAGVLGDHGLAAPVLSAPGSRELLAPGLRVVVEPLERGFLLPGVKLAVLAESDVTGRRRAHRRARPRARRSEGFFDDLAPGDYVVHHTHGVGRYGGMVTRAIGGAERDYLLLEYRGGDKLYVPSDQIDAITPYSGGESPSLNRLGGSEWGRTKAKVRSAVREIAQELVVLYRARVTSPGYAYPGDTPWQRELEEAFPYTETPDQAKVIDEVKADMEQAVPMDRL